MYMAQPLNSQYQHKTKTPWHKSKLYISMKYIVNGPALTFAELNLTFISAFGEIVYITWYSKAVIYKFSLNLSFP